VVALNRQARHRRLDPRLRVRRATEAMAVALAALDTQGVSDHRITVAVAAQDEVVCALRADGAMDAKAAHVAWLREGERPSRCLRALVHPHRVAASATALLEATGRLVTDVSKLPQMVADYWGSICTAPDIVSLQARAEVIGALYIIITVGPNLCKKGRAGGSSDRALKQEQLGLKETTTWSRQHKRFIQE